MPYTYEDRLMRVLTYIHDNLDGDLSLDRLADEAAMSRFHWHRVYRAMTGETCAQAVRRIRLHRAASALIKTDLSVDRISQTFGYPNSKSFARAFSETFGQTPRSFRASRHLSHPAGWPGPNPENRNFTMYDIDITDQPAQLIVALPHLGAYEAISRSFDQLSGLFTARGLWPHSRGMISVSCDNPDIVPEAQLRSFAGVRIDAPLTVEPPLITMDLAGGKYAVLHHTGPYAGLKAAYDQLYGQWLPQSGHEPADAWPYELYLNTPFDTAPEDLRTDICLPLK